MIEFKGNWFIPDNLFNYNNMDLNKVMLIGRLTRDPELRNIPSGQSVTSFGLATNRYWKGSDGQKQEQVEFHNIVLWARLAEVASQYLRKGSRIYIEGRLQTRDWTGQDGVKRYRTEIVAENMIMLDRAPGDGKQQFNKRQPAAPPTAAEEAIPAPEPAKDEIKVEEIPF